MHIAMVSEHASPLAVLGGHDAGGQNVHVAALSAALAARGHRITVYTRRDGRDVPTRTQLTAEVEVVNVPAGPASPLPKDELYPYMVDMALWLRNEWARTRPDVVHAHFWMSGLAASRAVSGLRHTPSTVMTFHALGHVKRRHQGDLDTSPPQRQDVERRLVKGFDATIATCRDEIGELLSLGAHPRRLHVVPCGVDVERFTPVGPWRNAWSAGTIRLLGLGRLVERKGIETVVQALRFMPSAELVIAGGPSPSDLSGDVDVQRIERCARHVGVRDRVRLLGRVRQDEAAALLRAADLLVTTPWYEPFGIVPLESMACGTPVVASAVGGMVDTVEQGVTGLLVPPRDPWAVSQAVTSLQGRPDLLRDMGAHGVRRAAKHYTWPLVARATESVYEQLDDIRTAEPTAVGDRVDAAGIR